MVNEPNFSDRNHTQRERTFDDRGKVFLKVISLRQRG